jgi:magnesium chelatase family protein
MAPADIKKAGAAYDLPMAIGWLAASEQIPAEQLSEYIIMGELSLDGSLQPIKGALPIAIQARAEKFKGLIIPKANAREAALVNNLDVYGVEHISEVIGFFEKKNELKPVQVNTREEFFDAQNHFDLERHLCSPQGGLQQSHYFSPLRATPSRRWLIGRK